MAEFVACYRLSADRPGVTGVGFDAQRTGVQLLPASGRPAAAALTAIASGCGFRPIDPGRLALRLVMDAFETVPPVVAWLSFSPS